MTGWHDLFIPSEDGIPLEAWYIPAKGGESDKLDQLGVRRAHAMEKARKYFQRGILHQLGQEHSRIGVGDDLVVVAVQNQSGHADLLSVRKIWAATHRLHSVRNCRDNGLGSSANTCRYRCVN